MLAVHVGAYTPSTLFVCWPCHLPGGVHNEGMDKQLTIGALLLAMALAGCGASTPKPVSFDWYDCMGNHGVDSDHSRHPGVEYGCAIAEHCYRVTCSTDADCAAIYGRGY